MTLSAGTKLGLYETQPAFSAGGIVVLDNLSIHKRPDVHAARPRTFEAICHFFARALELFRPTECAAYLRHCGHSDATRS